MTRSFEHPLLHLTDALWIAPFAKQHDKGDVIANTLSLDQHVHLCSPTTGLYETRSINGPKWRAVQ